MYFPFCDPEENKSFLLDFTKYFSKTNEAMHYSYCQSDCIHRTKIKFEAPRNLFVICLKRNICSGKNTKTVAFTQTLTVSRCSDRNNEISVIVHF